MTVRGALVWLALAACGDDPARVRLVAVDFANQCGRPDFVQGMRITAYGNGRETTRAVTPNDITIDDFPTDAEQLGVEVLGAGGAVVAIGKTPPLDFIDLRDGQTVRIAMAPRDGFCATAGDQSEMRAVPVVARAGAGALVVGGLSADYYDPETATFTQIPVAGLDATEGLAGAVLTQLPNGHVLLTGTARGIELDFDPETRKFGTPTVFDQRAYHGAVALDEDSLLVIGGCKGVVAGACDFPLHGSKIFTGTDSRGGPNLSPAAVRVGAQIFDLGVQTDGVHRYALAGGAGDAGVADVFAATDAMTTQVSGVQQQASMLDGGAVFTAFAADAAPASGAAAVIAPDGSAAAVASGPARAGARLVLLEDGNVIAIGGDPTGRVARYSPTTNAWTTFLPAGEPPTTLVTSPALVRLADGSVLVVGSDAKAWIYRPSIVGPNSAEVTALPPGTSEGVLTAPNPATNPSTGRLRAIDDGFTARALVGGPRKATGSVSASVRVTAGGVALIARQTDPGRMLVAELRPGTPARIARVDGATTTTVCSDGEVPPFTGSAQRVGLIVTGDSARATIDDVTVVTCSLSGQPERGQWGIAAVGMNAEVDVVTIAVGR